MATLLLVSLLLHALLVGGLPDWSIPSGTPARVLNATLRPAPQLAEASKPELPEPTSPHFASPPPRRLTDKPPPQPSVMPDVTPVEAAAVSAAAVLVEPAPLTPSTVHAPMAAAVTAMDSASMQDAAPSVHLVRAIPASSATLQYKVIANDPRSDPPKTYYGSGTLAWRADRETYDLDLQVRVNILFVSIGALSSHSQGDVQESGLTPKRYTETPRNRSTLAVNFNRDQRNSVTFSASTNSFPLPPGIQDRLSLLLQLGAIVRANPVLEHGGIEIVMAGTRGSVEPWRFVAAGTENVDTGLGPMFALHLRRAPRQRGDQSPDDQSMDIWLALESEEKNANSFAEAQSRQAYPVKIRFADANTTSYELTLEKIE